MAYRLVRVKPSGEKLGALDECVECFLEMERAELAHGCTQMNVDKGMRKFIATMERLMPQVCSPDGKTAMDLVREKLVLMRPHWFMEIVN